MNAGIARSCRGGPSPLCLDCRWCAIRLELDGRSEFWCVRRRIPLTQTIMWRRSCRDFAPGTGTLPGLPGPPRRRPPKADRRP